MGACAGLGVVEGRENAKVALGPRLQERAAGHTRGGGRVHPAAGRLGLGPCGCGCGLLELDPWGGERQRCCCCSAPCAAGTGLAPALVTAVSPPSFLFLNGDRASLCGRKSGYRSVLFNPNISVTCRKEKDKAFFRINSADRCQLVKLLYL